MWHYLIKLNVHIPYNPAIPLLGIYPKNLEKLIVTQQIFTEILLYISNIHNSQNLYISNFHQH